MSTVSIEPIPNQNYKGRQWGYMVMLDGHPYLRVWTGGTGECWNLLMTDGYEEDETMHVCDLDELIVALTALRDSDAHKEHVKRWTPAP